MVMARVDGKQRGITQIRLKHDLNQQQDLDLGQNSTLQTLKLNYAKAMARMVLGKETIMAVDNGTKAKTLKLKDRCKPDGIPEALITK